MKKETVKFRFNVTATLRDAVTGEILKVIRKHNIVPTVGRAAIASFLGSTTPSPTTLYPNYTALGTNTTAPLAADTRLGTETYRNLVASRTSASNVTYISAFYTATECNGTYKEAGLFIAGTAAANSGTIFSHVAINIAKTNAQTLTLDWTFTIS